MHPAPIALFFLAACGNPATPETPKTEVAPPKTEPAPETPKADPIVGDQPMGVAPAPVSAEAAKATYDAAIAALVGKTPTKQTVTAGGKEVVLYRWDEPRLTVSEACAPNGTLGSCQALDALRDMPTRNVNIGVGNPSSYYCPAAGGTEVPVEGPDGQDGMCRFADGSMVSDWSLVYVPQFGHGGR
jgi:putative hemolysin